MSGGYYNQQQHHHHHHHEEPPQYLQQNYGYQNQGFAPAFAPVQSEEYLRQPPVAPSYPTAPIHMPEPAPPVMRMTEPRAAHEPRVIIVRQPPQQRDDCCALPRCLCRTVDWLLTRICYVVIILILLGILLGLAIWLVNKYNRKHW